MPEKKATKKKTVKAVKVKEDNRFDALLVELQKLYDIAPFYTKSKLREEMLDLIKEAKTWRP